MSYINYNPNPVRKLVGDCVIRAISKVLNKDWEDTYLDIVMKGYMMHRPKKNGAHYSSVLTNWKDSNLSEGSFTASLNL